MAKGGGRGRPQMAQGGKKVPRTVKGTPSSPRMQQRVRTGNQTPTK